MNRAKTILLVALLTLAAFVLRITNFAQQPFLGWDDAIFAVQGRHLLETGRLGYTWGRPLHVLLIAGMYGLVGTRSSAGSLVSIFLGTLTVPVIWRLGTRTFGAAAALASAVLLAGSYVHVFWSRWTQSQAGVIFCLALGALVYAASLRADGGRPWRWVAAGALVGAAYTLHYSVFMLLAIWAAFELHAGFRFGWRPTTRLSRAAGLLLGCAIVVGSFAFVLMPPEHPLWYTAAGWYNWRALARGCCYIDEVITPFYEDGLGHGNVGDWTYYFRAVLAFEGIWGLGLMLAAWGFGLRATEVATTARPRDLAISAALRRQWVAWQAVGGFAVLVAASTAGGDARPKILALVLGPNIVLAGSLVAAGVAALVAWFPQVRWRSALAAAAAAGLLGMIMAWRALPLISISTPYDSVAAYLDDQATAPVVGLYSGSHVKPYVWQFYLGERFRTVENGDELETQCSAENPGLLIKSSDTRLPPNAETWPLVQDFVDPTTILVATHYEETANRSFFGGPLLPGPPGSIQLYDMRDCALAHPGS
jgi:hypothetical protein